MLRNFRTEYHTTELLIYTVTCEETKKMVAHQYTATEMVCACTPLLFSITYDNISVLTIYLPIRARISS